MLRVAILGAGRWGSQLISAFLHSYGVQIAAIVDPDRARLAPWKQLVPPTVLLTQLEESFSLNLDAVVIATPVATHADLAQRWMRKGVHVWIEKPLAWKLAEAEQIVAEAELFNRVCFVDHLMVYAPGIRTLRSMIREGRFGQLRHMDLARTNMGVVRTEENVIWSLGPHDIAIAMYLLDQRPDSVTAMGVDKHRTRDGIAEIVQGQLSFPGLDVTFRWSWLDVRKVRRLSLVGELGAAQFTDKAAPSLQTWTLAGGSQPHLERFTEEVLAGRPPLENAVQAFLHAVSGESATDSDASHGLAVVRVLTALDESLEKGRPVEVEWNR